MEKIKITILVITARRQKLLKRCLEHVLKLDRPSHLVLNILVGVNGDLPENYSDLVAQAEAFSIPTEFKFWSSRMNPSDARNQLLKDLDTGWVYFLDDDAYPKEDVLVRMANVLQNNSAAKVLGGPNLRPPQSNFFQIIQDECLSSNFGSFVSRDRYRSEGATRKCRENSLILCNLFVFKDSLKKLEFDARLKCCEESKLIDQIETNGGDLIYDPKLIVFHERRETLSEFLTQVFKYGVGRGQYVRQGQLRNAHWYSLPAFSFIYSVFFIVLVLLSRATLVHLLPFIVYSILLTVTAASVFFKSKRTIVSLSTILLLPFLHSAYGLGFLVGIFHE